MGVLHRALFTWFICLIFFILLVLRLDGRTRWSWGIVFIPMWLHDTILLIYLIFNMISHRNNGHDRPLRPMKRKIWYLTCALFKITTEIMICIKLEHPGTSMDIPLYFILIPVWIVLPVTALDLFRTLVANKT